MTFLRRRHNYEDWEYNDLARYNSERARGIVHTPEWQAKMAEKQRRFDQQYVSSDGSSYTPTTTDEEPLATDE